MTSARAVALLFALTACAGFAAAQPRLPAIQTTAQNNVPVCVQPNRLMEFARSRNPSIPEALTDLARTYRIVGSAYGVRWDMAFFQMLVETNDLTFLTRSGRPLYIQPEHFNFGGLTATKEGTGGERFKSLTLGVQAHIEHTLVYAGRKISTPVANRTRKLIAWRSLEEWQRGFGRPITFTDMALRWNPFSRAYADGIMERASAYFTRYCPNVEGFGASAPNIARPQDASIAAARISTAWVSPGATQVQSVPAPTEITPPKPRLARPANNASAPAPPTSAPSPPSTRRRVAALAPRRPPAARPKRPQTPAVKRLPKPAAKPKPPSANEKIRKLVSGRLVHLKSDFGAVIPVRFNTNGTMRGQAGNFAFFLGAARDRGKWWPHKGMLCKKWRTWFKGNEVCIKLTKRGRTVHWRSRDGRSGTAKIIR